MHATGNDPDDRPAVSVAPVDPVHTSRRRVPILSVAVTVVALLSGSALFVSGYSMGRQSAVEPGTPAGDSAAFRPFWDTYHTINERYAGSDIDSETIVQGAIRGMIGSLGDPYSAYLTSDEYRSSLQGISGQFEGIGAEIATEAEDGTQGCATLGPRCRLVIVAPIGGSPAEKAGLRPGDLVLATDGMTLDGLTVDAARERCAARRTPRSSCPSSAARASRSPSRSSATSSRNGRSRSRELIDGAVGYIRLDGFSDRAAEDMAAAVRAHVERDA